MNSSGCISLVSSPCASIETKSPVGLAFRSAHILLKYSSISKSSARLSSSVSMMPEPGAAVATSDQRVNFLRSSKGKSKSVASIWVVSSIDTLSTQLKVSPIGRESSTFAVRSLIRGSRPAIFLAETTGATVFLCTSCLGGSIAIKREISKAPSGKGLSIGKPSVMPCALEKFL